MAKLDMRVRLLGLALDRVGLATLSDERLIQMQGLRTGHNPVIDALLGGVAPGVDLRDETARGQDGLIAARVYRPRRAPAGKALPLIINMHGGGFTLGTLDQWDWLCSNVARGVGAVVVSLDYRLAPRHRWPAAPEDCYAALVDIAGRAGEFGGDPDRIAVMGDSAGGNLAAVISLMARDRGGPAIAHQVLVYPATDLTLDSRALRENRRAPIIGRAECLAFREHYLGGQDGAEPYISPLLAEDHSGLPPALVQVAEHDLLRDDGLRYAAALRAAGVPVRSTVYVGMPHGYLAFPRICRAAPQALTEICAELRTSLGT